MMAHPYFPNPEEDERRKQLPFKQRMKLFQVRTAPEKGM